jgi:hypothetical protein
VAALILIAFVLDLPRLAIEVLGLPLPLLGGDPPYLIAPALVLIAAYLYLRGAGRAGATLEARDAVFLTAILLCALIESLHWVSSGQADFRLLTGTLWWFVAYFAVRQHLLVSKASGQFVDLTLAIIVALGVLHLAALAIARLGGAGLAMLDELAGRNSLGLLLAGAVYLQWFVRPRYGAVRPWETALVVGLACVDAIVIEARSALVVLLLLAAARVALGRGAWRRPVLIALGVALTLGILAMSCGYTFLQAEGLAPSPEAILRDASAVDSQRSIVFRMAANSYLVEHFAGSPIIGVGAWEVLRTKAGGYPAHTYYLFPLAAYGLLGLLAYGVAIGLLFAHRGAAAPSLPVLAMLLLTVLSFVNDLYLWLAMLIAIESVRPGRPI